MMERPEVIGDYVVEHVGQCTCGMGEQGTYYGHEQYCGYEPVMTVAEWNTTHPDSECVVPS